MTNKVVMYFLLSLVSNLDFKPLFVPCIEEKFWKCLLIKVINHLLCEIDVWKVEYVYLLTKRCHLLKEQFGDK